MPAEAPRCRNADGRNGGGDPLATASTAPSLTAPAVGTPAAPGTISQLRQPPSLHLLTEEPWMQEIAPPQVPYQGTILAPATSVPTVAAASQPNLPPLPELVGLVKSPNGASAILQVGRIPTSVSVGEMLGSSGWRLYFGQQRRSGAGAAGEHQRLLG